MDLIKAFVAALKAHLTDNSHRFYQVNDMAGDTEGGFYTEVSFDMTALNEAIDEFTESFKKEPT